MPRNTLRVERLRHPLKVTTSLLLMFSLQACPVGLDHPLEEQSNARAEDGLVGAWRNLNEDGLAEISKVQISKEEGHTFRIVLTETTENFMAQDSLCTGWTTELGDRKFLCALADTEGEYYHYCYELNGDEMVTYDFALLDGGVDSVTSTASLREQLTLSLQKPECLSGRQVWKRVTNKPNEHHHR